MSKYTHLFFDLDNTLFDFSASSEIALQSFAEIVGLPYDDHFKEVYHRHNHAAWTHFENKLIDGVTLRRVRFEDTARELGIKIDGMHINRVYLKKLVENPRFIDNAEETLRKFSKTHQLVAVTNGLKEVQRPRLTKVNFDQYFAAVVVSDEIGYAKPENAYFQYAWKKAGMPEKSKVLMIGDNPVADIKGASNFGFDTCYIDVFNRNHSAEEATYRIKELRELDGIVG